MKKEEALRILDEQGAILHGHFVLNDGDHSSIYIDKDAFLSDPDMLDLLVRGLAHSEIRNIDADIVIGPEKGGIVLANRLAFFLGSIQSRKIRWGYAEKNNEGKIAKLRPVYARAVQGKRVVIVEDSLTNGKAVKETTKLVEANGGKVVAVAAVVNRGGVTAEKLGVPEFTALLDLNLPKWPEKECKKSQLCHCGVPINTNFGKGKEFLARQIAK